MESIPLCMTQNRKILGTDTSLSQYKTTQLFNKNWAAFWCLLEKKSLNVVSVFLLPYTGLKHLWVRNAESSMICNEIISSYLPVCLVILRALWYCVPCAESTITSRRSNWVFLVRNTFKSHFKRLTFYGMLEKSLPLVRGGYLKTWASYSLWERARPVADDSRQTVAFGPVVNLFQ